MDAAGICLVGSLVISGYGGFDISLDRGGWGVV